MAAARFVIVLLCIGAAPGLADTAPASRFCRPDQSCWPTAADWERLRSTLVGKLEQPRSPLLPCEKEPTGPACAAALTDLRNPYYIEDQPGGTESTGWLGAWSAAVSPYAVAAETAADVVAAVNFAREHKLKLVVKGTGHDYLGRSNAPDSLLVWTHNLRQITVQDAFVGRGCEKTQAGVPAVSVGAGTRWIEAYTEVTVKHGRYVPGGGCTSVGAAGGFTQGGGFGSWSKKYGTAAASMLEAEVVTADGKLVVANACQNQDLFWALRGGGGGTFGVVTKMTLMTHPLPNYFGFFKGSIAAKNDGAFKELLEEFLRFYRKSLNTEAWGEQVHVRGDNSLELSLAEAGLSTKQVEEVWKPFRAFIDAHPERFTMKAQAITVPATKWWNAEYIRQLAPGVIEADSRPGAARDRFWWSDDRGQVSIYWSSYQSRFIPLDRFEGANAKSFAESLFLASRHHAVDFHFNKGQAGASVDAVTRGRQTSVNPAVYQAAALVIVADGGDGYPGVAGHEPNLAKAEAGRAKVNAAMKPIRAATPGAGSYVNEADYFEPDWQKAFWGENYPRLLAIKRKWDPEGLFTCHHCVGSESRPSTLDSFPAIDAPRDRR
jgi:FAD/FMN-containing dehydrogenase